VRGCPWRVTAVGKIPWFCPRLNLVSRLKQLRDRRKRSILYSVLVLGVFAVLTVALTYPASLHAGEVLASPGDPLLNFWIIGWGQHALLAGPSSALHLFDANIFYPYRYTLTYNEHLLPLTFMVMPLWLSWPSPILPYNLLYFLTFLLSGFGFYLLICYWTRSRLAGLVAGFIFAFSPYRFGHLTQLNLLTTQWLPFTLLALHLLLYKKRLRDLALLTLFFNLQLLSAMNYALQAALLLVLILAFYLVFRRAFFNRTTLAHLAVCAVITAALNGPIVLLYRWVSDEMGFQRSLGDIAIYGASLGDYLTTIPHNWLYGWTFTHWQMPDHLTQPLFPGLTAILLALVGLGAALKRRQAADSFIPLALAVLAILSFILSLGANDRAFGEGLAATVRPLLLYRWLFEHLPGIQGFRVPARFAVLVMLAVAALAGYGFAAILRSGRLKEPVLSRKTGFSLAVLATVITCGLVLAENYSVPLTGTPPPDKVRPPLVYRWLNSVEPAAVILELPYHLGVSSGDRELQRMYLSSYHWRKLVNGTSGYNPAFYKGAGEVLNRFPDWRSIELMRDLGVDYVVLHPDEYGDRWPEVWGSLPGYLVWFADAHQVGPDYVLKLASPGEICTIRSAKVTVGVGRLKEEPKAPLEVSVSWENLEPAGLVSPPMANGSILARWQRGGSDLLNEQARLPAPFVLLPGASQEAELEINRPPVVQARDVLQLVVWEPVSGQELRRQFTLDDELRFQSDEPPESDVIEIDGVPETMQTRLGLDFGGALQLVGYEVSASEAAPCQVLQVTLYWQFLQGDGEKYRTALRLLGKERRVMFEAGHILQAGSGGLLADTYIFPLAATFPPGVYSLEIAVLSSDDQPVGEVVHPPAPLLVRPAPPDLSAAHQEIKASLAGVVTLLGYELANAKVRAGDAFRLTLYWQARRNGYSNATVFVQLLGPDGQLWAQQDNPPWGGWYPTSIWREGEIIRDDYVLRLRPGAPPGTYTLIAGMYLPESMERLPILGENGQVRDDKILLASIEVQP
jgi:hypothetical protein